MCGIFSELAHHLTVMHAHIMHISRLTAEMTICVEARGGTRLARELSDAAFQVSVNAQELDAEARRVHEIADALTSPTNQCGILDDSDGGDCGASSTQTDGVDREPDGRLRRRCAHGGAPFKPLVQRPRSYFPLSSTKLR